MKKKKEKKKESSNIRIFCALEQKMNCSAEG